MREHLHYGTFLQVVYAISYSKEPGEVALMTVESIETALNIKGFFLFLLNQVTDELKVVASYGLSDDYLNKGPVSALHSIAQSLDDGPVAIADITDAPHLPNLEEAAKEGIVSILSVPIQVNQKNMEALRVYTANPCEIARDDFDLSMLWPKFQRC